MFDFPYCPWRASEGDGEGEALAASHSIDLRASDYSVGGKAREIGSAGDLLALGAALTLLRALQDRRAWVAD